MGFFTVLHGASKRLRMLMDKGFAGGFILHGFAPDSIEKAR